MEVIHSVDQFLSTLKVGGQFWELCCINSKPLCIVGPHTILAINVNDTAAGKPSPSVLTKVEDFEHRYYISDLVDPYKGVLTDAEEAEAYLRDRQAAFAKDPEWQKLYQQHRELSEVLEGGILSNLWI